MDVHPSKHTSAGCNLKKPWDFADSIHSFNSFIRLLEIYLLYSSSQTYDPWYLSSYASRIDNFLDFKIFKKNVIDKYRHGNSSLTLFDNSRRAVVSLTIFHKWLTITILLTYVHWHVLHSRFFVIPKTFSSLSIKVCYYKRHCPKLFLWNDGATKILFMYTSIMRWLTGLIEQDFQ